MRGRQHPLRIDQGASAATGLVHGDEHLPRELTPGRSEAADDLTVGDNSSLTSQSLKKFISTLVIKNIC